MDVTSRSRSRVQERLEHLEAEYGSVEVTQTTFEVGPQRYQRAVERSRDGHLNIGAVVRDEDGAVLVADDEDIPRGQTRPDERLAEAVRRIVRETAGVDCSVTGAASANIHGIRNEETGETVYRLCVVFTAEVTDSDQAVDGSVRWKREAASELVTPRQ